MEGFKEELSSKVSKVSKPKASPTFEFSNDLNLANLMHEPSGDNYYGNIHSLFKLFCSLNSLF